MKIFRLAIFVIAGLFLIGLPEIASGQLIISEFRVRGPNGANDEFIELYNSSGADHTVNGGGTGYGVAASNGVARCVIPNGTVIPNRGHYLCVNSVGYSLASYPAGNGTTATGDATYTTDIPDNAGIAIFNTSVAANFVLANRMDAVGSTSEANTLYKEGTGYPALVPFSIDYAFARDECGKGGSITNMTACSLIGAKDTNNNAADFVFVDTNGTSAGAGQRLGTPGPQNLSSPQKQRTNSQSFTIDELDPCPALRKAPNRVDDFTSDPPNNSTFGTLDHRFRITNNSGGNVTRMKFRIVDLTTFPAPSGWADLRPRTSTSVVVTVDRAPCGTGTSNVTVNGTTLEQPPSQPNGGGFNSSMSVGAVTLGTPLANGASIDIRLLFGVQQTGRYKFGIILEALPGGGAYRYVYGTTNNPNLGKFAPFDFDGDDRTDLSIFRPSNGQWWTTRSLSGATTVATFGVSTDILVPGEYTTDAVTDIAIFRPATSQWFILRSENNTFFATPFGAVSDIPVPGDYDGDGQTNRAVYRPSTGQWWIENMPTVAFGNSTDRPVPADYDGDTITDVAIYRPGSGQWWINRSSTGTPIVWTFGTATDKVVQGDYTGDGKADAAFWRPSTGNWFILRSEDLSFYAAPFGISTDTPAPGDYDGDGRFDFGIFRPSAGTWFVARSSGGTSIQAFGTATDTAVPNVYVR